MSHILTFLKLNLAYYIMKFDIPKSQKNILLVYYYKFEQVLWSLYDPILHTHIDHVLLSDKESFMIY